MGASAAERTALAGGTVGSAIPRDKVPPAVDASEAELVQLLRAQHVHGGADGSAVVREAMLKQQMSPLFSKGNGVRPSAPVPCDLAARAPPHPPLRSAHWVAAESPRCWLSPVATTSHATTL